MKWIVDRLSEPSTHAGLAAILLAISSFFPEFATVLQSIAAIFGLTAAGKSDFV